MGDTTERPRRPLGPSGDYIYRKELDARIDGANARMVAIAVSVEQLRKDAKDDALRGVGRDEALGFGIEELAVTIDRRLRNLEARTLRGRIASFRAWWTRTLAALRDPLDAFPVELVALSEAFVAPGPGPVAVKPSPVALSENPIVFRIPWTGDPSCLPEELHVGYHEGNITRIDKALPVRNGDGLEVLCRVGDHITVAKNGALGVESPDLSNQQAPT